MGDADTVKLPLPPKPSTPSENVRVVVRCRPLSRKESDRKCKEIVESNPSSTSVSVFDPNNDGGDPKTFTFDSVFPPNSLQADVYNQVARPIVENVLQGYNGTIFAYGQTGTGKTFTMEGVYNVPELKGIIPNSFAQIFSHIQNQKSSQGQLYLVRCSYLEIYNEDVRDLLGKVSSNKLEVKEHKDKGVYVKDLSSFVVRNADDMDRIMGVGNKNRSVASTNMNSVSSRSHAIFTITVECSYQQEDEDKKGGTHKKFRVGKLNLVDLAGSERLGKTQATGDRLKEATKINLSLSNLGNVISALVDGNSHIPYRNSKLTRLLQDSLGGNSKTVMIANIGPADYNYDETVSTLRFANRAKNIKNHAIINEDPKDTLLRQFEQEIEELRKQLELDLLAQGEGALMGEVETNNVEDDDDEDPEDLLLPKEELFGLKGQLETVVKSARDPSQPQAPPPQEDLKEAAETKKHDLAHKLKSLQRKILVGGENLVDKSQQQEELLLRSMKELGARKEQEQKLYEHINEQDEERRGLEQRILNAQEQGVAISKKMKKAYAQYQSKKRDLNQMRLQCQEETEGLADEVKRLSKQLQYHKQIVDYFIPENYQRLIEKNIKWQPDSGEWTLRCVAYAGNNMARGTNSSSGGNDDRRTNRNKDRLHKNRSSNASVNLSGFFIPTLDDDEPAGAIGTFKSSRGFETTRIPMNNGNGSSRPSTSSVHKVISNTSNNSRKSSNNNALRSRMAF